MEFKQILKVVSPNGEIKEFKDGYITFGNITPFSYNCTCEDESNCNNDDCIVEGDGIFVTAFYDNDKEFKGFCINNEIKDTLENNIDDLLSEAHQFDVDCDDLYPLLKASYYEGICYTIDLNEDDYNTDGLNVSEEFIQVFEKHKRDMLEYHLEDFQNYYLNCFKMKRLRSEVYDFSHEASMLYEDLGNRHPDKDEYEYISKSLAPIVSGYIEHIALGF